MVTLVRDRIAWLQTHENDQTSPLAKIGLASFVKTACDLLIEKMPQVVLRDHQVTAKDPKDFLKELENFWTQLLVSLSEAKGFGPLSEIAWQKRLTTLTLTASARNKAVLAAELIDPSLGLAAYLTEDWANHSSHQHPCRSEHALCCAMTNFWQIARNDSWAQYVAELFGLGKEFECGGCWCPSGAGH